MKTTKEMEAYFLRIWHPISDIWQLKKAIRECELYLTDRKTNTMTKIINTKAVEVLGLETFLSGISRAAFHATCVRDSEDGMYSVSFDLLKWWK